ncbi:MAG: hypothetical protein MJ154_03955 [Candidatus Saccharibacteria bacterium]|nr:hypothetical protein [Candidatus Saccharibacteria bacterium]
MGEVHTFTIGESICYYFGGKKRKLLRKSIQDKGIYFAEFIVTGINPDNSAIAVHHGDKLCTKKNPCEGFGIILKKDDPHAITNEDFMRLREASDDELESFCAFCGFKTKEFMKSFRIFRKM